MRCALWVLSASALMIATLAAQTPQKFQRVKVTFIVEGMTCEGCATGLEATLKGIKGVKSARVSFKDRQAIVVLDETKTPLSALLTVVRRHHHTFRLALFVSVAEKDRDKATKALKSIKGVKTVKAEKVGVLVTWYEKAIVRYGDLVAALQKEGVKVVEQNAQRSKGDENAKTDNEPVNSND